MTHTYTYQATGDQVFTQQHWDTQIGRTTQWNDHVHDPVPLEVTGAVVAADGYSVEITLEFASDVELSTADENMIGYALSVG